MNDLSNTALVTIKCHAQDARQNNPVLNDQSALKVIRYLETNIDHSNRSKIFRQVSKSLEKHIALRALKYDNYVRAFLLKYPSATIINIGCGFDNRFERIDNGQCNFWDIDLPEIINLKSRIFLPNQRYHQLGQSVFDYSWLDKIGTKPVLLLAEGVFMYCDETDIKNLFEKIHEKLNVAEFAFEVFSSKWLKGWKKKMVDFKLKKELKFGKGAEFVFGIDDSNAIEKWSPNYQFIEDWSYFDTRGKRKSDFIRKIQWTVYYKL